MGKWARGERQKFLWLQSKVLSICDTEYMVWPCSKVVKKRSMFWNLSEVWILWYFLMVREGLEHLGLWICVPNPDISHTGFGHANLRDGSNATWYIFYTNRGLKSNNWETIYYIIFRCLAIQRNQPSRALGPDDLKSILCSVQLLRFGEVKSPLHASVSPFSMSLSLEKGSCGSVRALACHCGVWNCGGGGIKRRITYMWCGTFHLIRFSILWGKPLLEVGRGRW